MLPMAHKLILKEEKHEIMMTYDKLRTNPDIVERNLVLFAKFIMFETIIRNSNVRIESQRICAKRMLQQHINEEIRRSVVTISSLSDMSLSSKLESDFGDISSDENVEEEKKEGEPKMT